MSTDHRQALAAEINALLSSGEKIAAVKLYRDRVGGSLKDAVDAVEAIGRGESPQDPEAPNASDEASMDEIIEAIQAGRKLDAIKIYRTSSGKTLKESKEFIETLIERLDANDLVEVRSGCFSLLLIGISMAGLAFATSEWILG